MSYKRIVAVLAIVSMIAAIAMIPSGKAQEYGPIMDVLRHEVIKSPDAALIAHQTGLVDFNPDQIRTADIEKLDSEGNLITQDLGFHMGFIAYNIRDLAATDRVSGGVGWKDTDVYPYRMDLIGHYWPLADVDFRHALIHCYDQLGIIPPIYGYIVTPVRSLVPPAQSKYYSSAAEAHPYNPGNPFTSLAGEHSTVGILKAAGYTFVDAGTIGSVDPADYWKCPDGSDLPQMRIFTPLMEVAPTSYQHGAEFASDLAGVGLKATSANGDNGLINQGNDFNEYLNWCYGTSSTPGGLMDAYMVFYSLGRIPDQVYDLMHSTSETATNWARRNAVGIIDPTIDALTETVRFSLDPNDIEVAAKQVQLELYDTTNDFALAYMLLYSRSYFNAFVPGLDGVVKSPGYGSDNTWTYLAAHWETGGRYEDAYGDSALESVMIYVNGDEPDSFNYAFATTVYEWNIIGQTVDGLINVNPYNHYDMPWIATDWTITEVGDGMNIDYTIRSDVEWQDGKPLTAYDIEWSLEFTRDREIPRYFSTWEPLIDVVVTDNTHFQIQLSEAGLGLFYDISGLAMYFPRHIWDRAWADNQAVLDYDPRETYNVATGYTAGPHPTPTNIMGLGPYIYQFYDTVNWYDDMYRNPNYFMSRTEIADLMMYMFWEVGDENYNGLVNVSDLTQVSFAFGSMLGDPNWNADANFDGNSIVDMRDLRTSSYHLLWQEEWMG